MSEEKVKCMNCLYFEPNSKGRHQDKVFGFCMKNPPSIFFDPIENDYASSPPVIDSKKWGCWQGRKKGEYQLGGKAKC